MQALLILFICLVTLAILAGRYGVDSRDGLDWSPPDRARAAAASSEPSSPVKVRKSQQWRRRRRVHEQQGRLRHLDLG
jgi:hypothetical protein